MTEEGQLGLLFLAFPAALLEASRLTVLLGSQALSACIVPFDLPIAAVLLNTIHDSALTAELPPLLQCLPPVCRRINQGSHQEWELAIEHLPLEMQLLQLIHIIATSLMTLNLICTRMQVGVQSIHGAKNAVR